MAPLPLDRSPPAEYTRLGDQVAQEMFDLLATETRQLASPNWKRLQRDLASSDSQSRSAASKILSEVAEGTQLQTQRGAKNACCLILYTLAGLTLEQIGLAFDHDKGHIQRLIRNAAAAYARLSGQLDSDPGTASPDQTISRLSIEAPLTRREKDRIRRKAARFIRAVLTEPEPIRSFFLQELRKGLQVG